MAPNPSNSSDMEPLELKGFNQCESVLYRQIYSCVFYYT